MTKLLRRVARWYLLESWKSRLPYVERVRLEHYGATGNPLHTDPCAWIYDL